jgi:hypothetical protein
VCVCACVYVHVCVCVCVCVCMCMCMLLRTYVSNSISNSLNFSLNIIIPHLIILIQTLLDKGYPKLVVEYCVKADADGFLLGTRTQKCLISAYLRLECFSEAMLVLDVIEREEVQVQSGVLSVLQPYRDVRDALRLSSPAISGNNSSKDNVNHINDDTLNNKNTNDDNYENLKIENMEDCTVSKENKIKFLDPTEYRNQNMARFNDPNLKDKDKEKEELFFGLDLFCFVILMTSSFLRKNIVTPRLVNSASTSTSVRALYLRVILISIRRLSDTK